MANFIRALVFHQRGNIQGMEYIVVAEVVGQVVIEDEFLLSSMNFKGQYRRVGGSAGNNAECFVLTTWLHKVSELEAVNDVGCLLQLDSVAGSRKSKWEHTVNRLRNIWQLSV